MSELCTPLERLYNLHTFVYEYPSHGQYTPVPVPSTEKGFPKIWQWLEAALGEAEDGDTSYGVEECFLLLLGEGEFPSVVARTWCDKQCGKPEVEADEVPDGQDPVALLNSRLRGEPLPGQGWQARGRHMVASFYMLYEDGRKSNKPDTLSDLLNHPTYLVTEGGRLKPIEGSGDALTAEEVLADPEGARYYQRVCIIFGCASERAAARLAEWADKIVCGLITTWGGALERAKERAQAAELESQAWAHEIGNFIRYLDWTANKEFRHLYELALDFLEIGTRASVKFQQLPKIVSDWAENMKAEKMLLQAIEYGTKFAVLRNYRGGSKEIETNEGFTRITKSYEARFGDRKILDQRLRLHSVRKGDIEANQRLAAFAQFIIFALYSAARHSPDEGSVEIELSRNRLFVKNRIKTPPSEELPKSEVRAILHQAFKVLWDNKRDEFICDPEGGFWITEADLPENLWEA
jgi:hypothetical protein